MSFLRVLFLTITVAVTAFATPHTVDARTLRVAVPQLPVFQGVPYGRPFGGNPEAFTIPALFEGLTYLDASGALQPLLAVSWERVTDTHWQFRLREGVTFSNGVPFTADVVRRNLAFVHEETSAAYSVVQQVAHRTSCWQHFTAMPRQALNWRNTEEEVPRNWGLNDS